MNEPQGSPDRDQNGSITLTGALSTIGGSTRVTYLAQEALRVLASKALYDRRNAPTVSNHCVNAFCSLVMSGQVSNALNFTHLLMSRGADYGEVAENLFAAASRRMGDRWSTGDASILELNVGVSALLRTDTALRAALNEPHELRNSSALFVSFSGQAHTLGLTLATGYFRQNGWSVLYLSGTTADQFLATVSAEAPDIVGMTATSDEDIDLLGPVIEQLRNVAYSPRIIVGGGSPHLASLNADAIASRLDMGLLAGHRLTH